MENEHWYAMYVKMHHEKKTAEKLYKMGVKHYLPLQETVKQWSDRKKKVKEIVIPMIIFIKSDDLPAQFRVTSEVSILRVPCVRVPECCIYNV